MIAELLIIGNEILIGKTQDTNSRWLAKRITKYGHQITRITTIGDDIEIVSDALREVMSRKPDIIITTGGLIKEDNFFESKAQLLMICL